MTDLSLASLEAILVKVKEAANNGPVVLAPKLLVISQSLVKKAKRMLFYKPPMVMRRGLKGRKYSLNWRK